MPDDAGRARKARNTALALFQPDIPQNTGALLRLGACLGVTVHIIEPAGFRLDDRAFRRAGMDYLDRAAMRRHDDWPTFDAHRRRDGCRLLLLTTRAQTAYTDLTYRKDDILLLGQESVGAPPYVHDAVDARIGIPMAEGMRSLNMAVAASMVLGEALRQTGGFGPDRAENKKDVGE